MIFKIDKGEFYFFGWLCNLGIKIDNIKIFFGLYFFYMYLFECNNFGYIISVKEFMISFIFINIFCFMCKLVDFFLGFLERKIVIINFYIDLICLCMFFDFDFF